MRKLLILVASLLLLSMVYLLVPSDSENQEEFEEITQKESETLEAPSEPILMEETVLTPSVTVESEKSDSLKDSEEVKEHQRQGAKEIKSKLNTIARDYEEQIKYPPYSVPLGEHQESLLTPNQFIPIKRLMPDSEGLYGYDVILPKSLLFKENPISVTFRVYGLQSEPVPQVHQVSAALTSGKNKVASFDLELKQNGEMEKTFHAEFHPSLEESKTWGLEMRMKITFLMSGFQEQSLVTLFRYSESEAKIESVGTERVEGSHLVIPVNLRVNSNGHYSLSANLFSESLKKPIAYLTGNQRFTEANGTIELKAHVSALKKSQDPGPYLLKTFVIHRRPEKKNPGAYGNTHQQVFTIPSHELSEYSAETYIDPGAQKKLERFKQLIQAMGKPIQGTAQ